ncbi:hypothetical protein HPP92_003951 [Vanilla planifolia]|uniref:Uncharacterized protein n=1 Tax=Vanilla planifolia TaxID=51239 RepID=A0A835S2S6_VANPL|nr:hypothetical protein HPP92_003951 [Vanilla planifolia]
MLSFRALLCHRTISFLRETRLLRAGPILSLSAVENVFDRGPIISCMHIHASHSDAQLPDEEEGDSAAGAWSLLDPSTSSLSAQQRPMRVSPGRKRLRRKGQWG